MPKHLCCLYVDRKPSDIDPAGKSDDPAASSEAAGEQETNPTANASRAEEPPIGNQSETANAEARNEPPTGDQSASAEAETSQEPSTGNQSEDQGQAPDQGDLGGDDEMPDAQDHSTGPPPSQEDNTEQGPSMFNKVEGPAQQHTKIITGLFFLTLLSVKRDLHSSSPCWIFAEPLIGEDEEIPRIKSAEDSHPPILVKWYNQENQPQGIVINKQKEDEVLAMLKKTLNEATRLVNVSIST